MKKIILFSLFIFIYVTSVNAQCPNLGFEENDFSNWTGYTGNFNNPMQTLNIVPGRHTIMTPANGIDPETCGGLSCVPPGENISARLGNSGTGAQAEVLAYSMQVTPQNSIFVYKYAVVMEDPGHDPSEQPKLTIQVTDQSGNQIGGSCGIFDVYAGQNGQSFNTCNDVKWLDWSTAVIDLSPFMGQNIQIQFTTKDCSLSGHFGYAYLWAQCMPPILDAGFCVGQDAVIEAPAGFQSYQWNTGQTSSTITISNPSVGDSYTCELGSAGNQGNCQVTLTYVLDVTDPVAGLSGSDACVNDAIQFTDLSTTNMFEISEWSWDFGDGQTSVLQNPTHSYSLPGTYNVTLTAQTSNGCSTSETISVTVEAPPVPDFSFSNVCFNEDVNFVSQVTGNAAFISWDLGDGTVSSDNSISHLYTSAGQYDVQLNVESSLGCRDSLQQTIIVHPLPNANFTVDPVCLSTGSFFTDLSTVAPVSDDVIEIWEWDFGNSQSSAQASPTYIYPSEGTYTAELLVTTNNGCQDAVQVPVTVYPNPVAAFSVSPVCELFTSFFVNNSTVSNAFTPNQITSTVWDFGDGEGSSNSSPSHTYSENGTFNVELSVTSNNGCVSAIEQEVTIYPKPYASFEGIELSGCAPICPELTSTSVVESPSTLVDYEWLFSDGYTDNGATISRCFDNFSGETLFYGVTLIVTTEEGCNDTLEIDNYIEVYHNPIAEFDFSPQIPDRLNNTVEFQNSSIYANYFDWTFGSFASSELFEPSVVFPEEPGQYNVMLVASTLQGCVDTAFAIITLNDVLIFYVPNTFTPDNDAYNNVFLPVFTYGFDPYEYQLLIFNRWGEILFESNDSTVGWNGMYNGEPVQDGTYTWKISYKRTDTNSSAIEVGHVNVLR